MNNFSSGVLLLKAEDDHYDGVIVDPTCLPSDVASFVSSLTASIAHWKSQSKRGIWLKLPIQNANLVPPSVQEGFVYHHAEPDYLMLTYWIPEVPSTLPNNASHQVGVGALIINENKEILVVQERSGPMRGSGVWKIPTGVVNQNEDIIAGAKREVKEETGVDAEFIQVVGFRQSHDAAFGKSDLFFLCMLRPTSTEIVIQESEIEAAKWMPLEELGAQPLYATSSMLKRIVEIATASIEGQYTGFSADFLHIGFRTRGSYFYCNMKDISEYNKNHREGFSLKDGYL